MNEEDLKRRTKQFGLRVIKLTESLQGTSTARTIGNQLLRAGMSVGQIIARHAAGNQKRILSPKPGFPWKRQMNVCIGWNYFKKQILFPPKNSKN